ncbi:hypothetical protein KJ662_03625 [Patescibacteria group bacterium]|nr:hypothetical protein [Patescibacteria group bacterium]
MQSRNHLRVALPKKLISAFLILFLVLPVLAAFAAGLPQSTALIPAPSAEASAGDETTYYFLTDHLGSVDAVLDEQGNVVERRDYLPYGSERVKETFNGVPITDLGFTGQRLDDETGLNYYGARYYDPVTGRFITMDPLLLNLDKMSQAQRNAFLSNPQNLNMYSYVQNNPVRYTDPTGMYEEDIHMYLTNFLAVSAGFSDMDAFSIGLYDQLTDTDPATTPWRLENKQYHFPEKNDLEKLAMEAIGTLENKAIGRYLHATQDSYAHAGFKAELGGHIWLGRLPDKTYLDQKRANIMAEDTFLRLRLLNRLKNGTGGLKLDAYNAQTDEIWFQIRDDVYAFSATNTLDKKREILEQKQSEKDKENKRK